MAENTREVAFDLPQELAEKYKKKEVVFDIPSNLPQEQQVVLANKLYDDWYASERSKISNAPSSMVTPKQYSAPEALYKGIEKGLGDIAGGIKKLGYKAEEFAGFPEQAKSDLEALQREQIKREASYYPVSQQRPFTSLLGEIAPTLPFKSPIGIGAFEALKYKPTSGEQAVTGLMTSGTVKLGNIGGEAIGKYFNPAISKDTAEILKWARENNIQPRLSESMGSTGVAKLEDVVTQAPGGGALTKVEQKNQSQYNKIAAKSIGQDANALTEDVLNNARKKIGETYTKVSSLPVEVAPIKYDTSMLQASNKILSLTKEAKDKLGINPESYSQLANIAKNWQQKAKSGEVLSPTSYNQVREILSNLAWDAEGSVKTYYRDLLNALDDSAEKSLVSAGKGDLATELKLARSQYSNLKTLEKGNVVQNGNVNLANLKNAVKLGKEAAYKEGRLTGDLANLAKYREATSPIREGSQTFTRTAYETLLKNPVTELPTIPANFILSNILASPGSSFIPRVLGGTVAAPIIGGILERAGKVPTMFANQQLILDRMFPKKGLLGQEEK